jgi:hypothetical protein
MIALTTVSGMALHRAAVAISARFLDGFSSVHDVGLEFACGRDLVYIDPLAKVGAVADTITGSVLLGDWTYPANKRVTDNTRMAREIAPLIVDGIAHRERCTNLVGEVCNRYLNCSASTGPDSAALK